LIKVFFAILAALLALAVGATPAAAQAREKIVDFHSEIWVHPDASMMVRETITVDSARRKIRRGIFRDFPTIYRGPAGNRIVVGFEIEGITRAGRREPFHTERQSNGVRIYIGDEDVVIPKGRHVYRITYRTNRQLGHFDGYDELFWNVTGNGWDFPIEKARATVHLPDGARVINHAGYTGPEGARGRNFTYTVQSDGTLSFESSRGLKPREGLTIAVSWPPGFVQRPSEQEKIGFFLDDNRVALAGVFGLALLLIYYLVVWARVGRDPGKGPVFPLYEPPDGFSPAGSRYVTRMGFDDKAFTAAIVSMAVKGFLTIRENLIKTYTLEVTGQSPRLSSGESAVARKLFPGSKKRIDLEPRNHEELQSAKKALQQALRTEFEKIYFVLNTRSLVPGIGLTVLTVVLLVVASDDPEITAFVSVWLTFWTGVVYYLVRRIWRAWRSVLSGGGAKTFIEALFFTLFSLPFIGGEFMGLTFFAEATTVGAAVVLVLLQLTNGVFYHLLKAPTRLGRRAMDDIEGFKEYLSVAEQDRMNLLNPPQRTPELFEQFLPYALALGVEQQWAEQFSDVLAGATGDGTASGRHYSPRWYSGTSFGDSFADCAAALGSGFSGAISSASTAPGSSSGSGGGGSSGGGGGGGGGGGW
jgi:hypothetical protein